MPKTPTTLVAVALLSLAGSLCGCQRPANKTIPLLSSGVSRYSIVYAANAIEAEKTAAKELAEHLQGSFGIALPLEEESEKAAPNGPSIYVGQTQFARSHGISFDGYDAEQWLIKAVGPNLVIGGGRPRGTLYGVFEFLEEEVGVMWMDETDTHIPRHTTLALPGDLERSGKPTFPIRGIFVFNREDEKRIRYMIHNRDNIFHDQRPFFTDAAAWGLFPIYGSPRGCHTFSYYTKDWPEQYEDCFSLDANGKRLRAVSALGPGQVCFSNPLARELFIAKLKEYIKTDRKAYPEYYPLIYDVSTNDNHDKCVCPDCLALATKYGAYSGAQLEFINAVADGVADEYPDVIVQTFAYQYTEDAPKGIVPRPNVMTRIAQLDAEFKSGIRDIMRPLTSPLNKKLLVRIQEWGAIGKISIWDYLTLFSGKNEAMLNIGTFSQNLRLFKENNARAYFAEYQSPDAASFSPLRLWLAYQLLQDPNQDVGRLTDRFLRVYFGAAAAPMKELADFIETNMNGLQDVISTYDLAKRPDLNDDYFETTERLLDAAEQAAQGDQAILGRIARERIPLDLARLKLRDRVSEGLRPGRDAVAARLQRNWPEWVKRYYPVANQERQLQKIDIETRRLSASAQAPLPPELENRRVIDILWPSFEPITTLGTNVVNVPDAAAGKALHLAAVKGTLRETNNHEGGLSMGVYSNARKKHLKAQTIPPEKLPQDEQFHLYPLGKVTLEPKSKLWVHKSWIIQQNLGEFYETGGLPNDYEIYVSVKLEGPSYVKGSEKTDAVYVDRVLLVKPE